MASSALNNSNLVGNKHPLPLATERKFEDEGEGKVLTRPKTQKRLARPRLYKVLLHNDDFTPRDFVVMLLQGIYQKSESDATQIMLHVHNNGVGVIGIYPFSVAETRVAETLAAAEQSNYPLMCTLEPDEGSGED